MKYYGKLFGEERGGKRPRYWDTGKTGQDWEKIEQERDEARAMASDQRNQLDKTSPARLLFPWENT